MREEEEEEEEEVTSQDLLLQGLRSPKRSLVPGGAAPGGRGIRTRGNTNHGPKHAWSLSSGALQSDGVGRVTRLSP